MVAYFDRTVAPQEIQSVLPSYFEEAELVEFETFLNKTPDLDRKDQEAGISWDAVRTPLAVVSEAVVQQRDQRFRDSPKTLSPMTHPAGILFSEGGTYPAGVPSPSSGAISPENGHKIFDISVSPDVTSRIETPVMVHPVPETASGKNRIKPFVPVIIGAVIILIIFGFIMISGSWNPAGVGNTTNSTTVTVKNTTTVKPTATLHQKQRPQNPLQTLRQNLPQIQR